MIMDDRMKALLGMIALLALVSSVVPVHASSQTSQAITAGVVSLGNSTCTPLECDRVDVYFYVPMGLDKPQYLKWSIVPACFGGGIMPLPNETWAVQFYCVDGYNETIDLKQSACDNSNPIVRWTNISRLQSQAYFFYDNVQYEEYWCAFKRDQNSINRVPVEFSYTIDSLGLTSQQEETVLSRQSSAMATVTGAIFQLFTINYNAVQIIFYLVEAVTIILGFIIVVTLIPLALKWIVKKITA